MKGNWTVYAQLLKSKTSAASNVFLCLPTQVRGQRRDVRVLPVQDEGPVRLRGRRRGRGVLLRHARPGVRLGLPAAQPEAGVHLLPGQRALLQTPTPQDGRVPRDPARLPGVRQENGVREASTHPR